MITARIVPAALTLAGHRTIACALIASTLLIAALAPAPAAAQSAAATVNGEAITPSMIDERIRVQRMVFRRTMTREQALSELIDDAVKMQEARRLGMRVTDEFVTDTMSRMAASNRMTRVEFESALVRANISPNSLLDVMRAQAIWQELLRLRARNSNVSNAEINAEVDQRMRRGEGAVTDYVLRQVIFVVNAGNPAGARERDAAAARGRVQDCDASVDYLRTLREVAVRERIARTSTEISKQLNDMLQKTAQGRMTPTFRTDQGVEALIVCEKRERQDIGALRATVERELSSRRVEGSANSYLSELKQRVEIVRR